MSEVRMNSAVIQEKTELQIARADGVVMLEIRGGKVKGDVAKTLEIFKPGSTNHMVALLEVIKNQQELIETLVRSHRRSSETPTPQFLNWIADRLVYVHGNDPNVDFVLSLRERARRSEQATAAISEAGL